MDMPRGLVLDRSKTGIVGSKPPYGMNACQSFLCYGVLCRQRPYDVPISRLRNPTKMSKKGFIVSQANS
jgi:hypothetical protein